MIKVVSQQEAEEASLVVCMPDDGTRYFSDDVETTCAWCGRGIIHRPHVPAKPPKVCAPCVQASLTQQQ
jgi:hypothetical protein